MLLFPLFRLLLFPFQVSLQLLHSLIHYLLPSPPPLPPSSASSHQELAVRETISLIRLPVITTESTRIFLARTFLFLHFFARFFAKSSADDVQGVSQLKVSGRISPIAVKLEENSPFESFRYTTGENSKISFEALF